MIKIKNFIINKLYFLLETKKKNQEEEKVKNIKFKKIGANFHLGKDCTFFNPHYIEIGNNFGQHERNTIEAVDWYNGDEFNPIISIGNDVNLVRDNHIGAINKIVIGDNTLIASKVFITDHFHGKIDKTALLTPPNKRKLYSPGPVIIGKNVWIGEGVCILPNVSIGDNTIIGANSVITKSFPANCVVAGNPGKLIRRLE